jgi:hypothetical protein
MITKNETNERVFNLKCQMTKECTEDVTHVDEKGFIYCACHGYNRRVSGRKCRKLTKKELKTLIAGIPLERY